jgi:hypothetical protein
MSRVVRVCMVALDTTGSPSVLVHYIHAFVRFMATAKFRIAIGTTDFGYSVDARLYGGAHAHIVV